MRVWWFPLEPDGYVAARVSQHLTPDERDWANGLGQMLDPERWIVARGMLREILGARLALDPRSIRFRIGRNGRLTLPTRFGPDLDMSHSWGIGAVAVARRGRVGVDVKAVRPITEARQVAARFFAMSERRQLDRLDPEDHLEGFYRCWTQKEAVLRATGDVGRSIQEIEVACDPNSAARVVAISGDGSAADSWSLVRFEAGAGAIGAVALDEPDAALEVGRWDAGADHLSRAVDLLQARGAGRVEHSGGTLLDHLLHTRAILVAWDCADWLCNAGLFHSAYGTEAFDLQIMSDSHDRSLLGDLVGPRSEELVWLYHGLDVSRFSLDVAHRDNLGLDDATITALAHLIVANHLEQTTAPRSLGRTMPPPELVALVPLLSRAAVDALRYRWPTIATSATPVP